MEQVRPRVVAHRVGPTLGVHNGVDRLTDPKPTVEDPAVDDQPPERSLRVADGEERGAAARLAQLAAVADLAAALGVEGRPIEDDFGLALAGQLVEFHAVADDRDDATLRLGRLVAEKLAVSRTALDRAVERGNLGLLRQRRLLAAPAALALLSEGRLETRPIDARPRIRPRAPRSGRTGIRTCRGA